MMKNIDDMKIGESFYLKWTVAKISERNNKPCEYDEERIDVNALIIDELEKVKEEIKEKYNRTMSGYRGGLSYAIFIIDNHISELKGE